MILNGVKRNNKEKTYIVNVVLISIEFCFSSFKIPIFKRDDLIKNDDIKPDWSFIKRSKF